MVTYLTLYAAVFSFILKISTIRFENPARFRGILAWEGTFVSGFIVAIPTYSPPLVSIIPSVLLFARHCLEDAKNLGCFFHHHCND